jgi:hypothetical protein
VNLPIPEPLKRVPPIAWLIGGGVVLLLVLVKGKGGSSGSSGGSSGVVAGAASGGGGDGGNTPDLNQEFTQLASQQQQFQDTITKQITPPSVIEALRSVASLEQNIISQQNQRSTLLANRASYATQLNTLNDKLRAAKTTAARSSIKRQIKTVTTRQASNTAALGKLDAVITALTKQLTETQKGTVAPVAA